MASMGIYIFNWKLLRKMLVADMKDPDSNHDFGKDIIPALLNDGKSLYAYKFQGYWKDVGTIDSLWEANMDLLGDKPVFNLKESSWRIYSRNATEPPHYTGEKAVVANSLITEGCEIYGKVENSILSNSVIVEEGAVVKDSIIMSAAVIKAPRGGRL